MTLDEAILHSEEKAEQLCGKCAEEHAQLAEWLKELKIRRETIEAEPVRHGHWVDNGIRDEFYDECECSNCGFSVHGKPEHQKVNYCPECGAKMDEEEGP